MASSHQRSQKKKESASTTRLKLLPLAILEILKEQTSPTKRLTASKINEALRIRYDYNVTRQALAKNLQLLASFDENVRCEFTTRKTKKGEELHVAEGWYYEAPFDVAEIQYVADAVTMFSQRLPYHQKQKLLEKIIDLGGPDAHGVKGIANFYSASPDQLQNKEFFYTVSILQEAISSGKRVTFAHAIVTPKRTFVASDYTFTVDPGFLCAGNGHYYLVGTECSKQEKHHYRIDLICNIAFATNDQEEPLAIDPANRLKGREIQDYIDKHLFMYSDPIEVIEFRFENKGDACRFVIDSFGSNVSFRKDRENPGCLLATVRANTSAMAYWALQYGGMVEVTRPESLRNTLYKQACELAEKYRPAATKASW